MVGAVVYNFYVRKLQGEPTRISKLNTALQLVFVVSVLAHAGFGYPIPIISNLIGLVMTVTVIVSGVDYVASWIRDYFKTQEKMSS